VISQSNNIKNVTTNIKKIKNIMLLKMAKFSDQEADLEQVDSQYSESVTSSAPFTQKRSYEEVDEDQGIDLYDELTSEEKILYHNFLKEIQRVYFKNGPKLFQLQLFQLSLTDLNAELKHLRSIIPAKDVIGSRQSHLTPCPAPKSKNWLGKDGLPTQKGKQKSVPKLVIDTGK